MRIALVAGSYYSDATTFSVFDGLSRALSAQGHSVFVLTRTTAAPPDLHFQRTGRQDRVLELPGSPRLPFALLHALRAHRIEAVHLHFSGWFRHWLWSLLLARWRRSFALTVTFQDYHHPEMPHNTLLRRLGLRLLLRRATRVSAISRYLLDRVLEDFPSCAFKSAVVPNGVALRANAARSRRPPHKPYILSVGRLSPYKGTDLVLMAFAELRRKGYAGSLVLCGAGFHHRHFAALARKLGLGGSVRFTGLQTPAEVARLMEGCLFLVAAPRFETFGMAVLEAMALGKAVVATRTGGIPEYLRHEIEGLLVAPKSVAQLAGAMERLITNPGLRRRLAETARRTAKRFRWEKVAGRYARLYAATGFSLRSNARSRSERNTSPRGRGRTPGAGRNPGP